MGQASPQPIVTITSAARAISSVQGFGYSAEMSMPTSAIAAIAVAFVASPGSDPPENTSTVSPARRRNQPAAIWERPALCTQRNRTAGRSKTSDSSRASAVSRSRVNRSIRMGSQIAILARPSSRVCESAM
jgi:hypothetical protein